MYIYICVYEFQTTYRSWHAHRSTPLKSKLTVKLKPIKEDPQDNGW